VLFAPLRLGNRLTITRITIAGRLCSAALTVSSLVPSRSNRGYVVVVDDLTDLLRAQKAAAWQDSRNCIAHEIKPTDADHSLRSTAVALPRSRPVHPQCGPRARPPELVRLVAVLLFCIEFVKSISLESLSVNSLAIRSVSLLPGFLPHFK